MRPTRSWPLRTWIMRAGAFLLLLHQRAGWVGRLEGVDGRNGLDDLVVVPRVFRFLGRLDLREVHVVTMQSVGADPAVLREEVVHGQLAHLGHHLVPVR